MTTARDLANPRTVADLVARRAHLERLLVDIHAEICAVEDGLRVAGLGLRGRPRKRPTHTHDEALEAHRLHAAGESSAWIDAGERQYQRTNQRQRRNA